MNRLILTFLFSVVLIVSTSAILANSSLDDSGKPNDPAVNENANACYTGGTLEGKCDSDVLWKAGWYLIRFEKGIISRAAFPRYLIWVLPPEIKQKIIATPSDSSLPPDMSCYIQVNTTEYEYASLNVLSGNDEGDFYWSAGRLMNDYAGWTLWDNAVWSVNYYGDCSPLGLGDPAPLDLTIVSPIPI